MDGLLFILGTWNPWLPVATGVNGGSGEPSSLLVAAPQTLMVVVLVLMFSVAAMFGSPLVRRWMLILRAVAALWTLSTVVMLIRDLQDGPAGLEQQPAMYVWLALAILLAVTAVLHAVLWRSTTRTSPRPSEVELREQAS